MQSRLSFRARIPGRTANDLKPERVILMGTAARPPFTTTVGITDTMQPWEVILLALGGNAALLAVLGWLGHSLGSQLLAKDLEHFKTDLSAASSAAAERLKHDLHIAATEHQVRYAKLYERRAEAIAELYGLLVEAHWASQAFVAVFEFAGEPPKSEKYVTAMNKAAEFYRFFDKNRIYLPPELCGKLEDFVRNMRRQVIGFGVYVNKDEKYLPDHVHEAKYEAWTKAAEYFDKEVPEARAALESELRAILGGG